MDSIPRCILLIERKIEKQSIHSCSLREALLWQTKKETRKL